MARGRRLSGWARRALGLDERLDERLDHLDLLLQQTHHATLTTGHAASRIGEELARVRTELHDVAHRAHHLEDVAVADVQRRLKATEAALAALVHQSAWIGAGDLPTEGPLVTVVTATWQRARELPLALRSLRSQTYRSWECIVVDDGSDDGTDDAVKPFLEDARITYERIEHAGVAAARNHGLGRTRGEVVTYLDSDNTWHPTHLARVVHALAEAPEAEWLLTGQLVVDEREGSAEVRSTLRSTSSLRDANHCDLNAVAHRRDVLEVVGAFDPTLPRMSDWDLVLRLAARGEHATVDPVTSTYRIVSGDRISDEVPPHLIAHRIRARHRGRPAAGLRVLFAEWHYPQVTESYIAAVVTALARLGAEVEVWSQDDVAVPYTSPVPVRRGDLGSAIEDFRPHLAVTHWVSKGRDLRPTTRAFGVPHVVRVHGFEYDPATVAELLADPGVLVHTFPHLVDPAWSDHPRLDVTVTCFDDDRYGPPAAGAAGKDRRLVARTAAGLLTKDIETFLLAADLCPDHRFVLILGHSYMVEERTEQLLARHAELGSRAEVLVDLSHDEVADVLSRAGTYLHTHGTDHPVTMPISIAEAMASGCVVLARDLPGIRGYVGRAGDLYTGADPAERAAAAAARIRASADWTDAMWSTRFDASVDQAFERYAAQDVVDRMVRTWRGAFTLPPAPTD